MTDSVATKLSDLSLKQSESRGKLASSSHSGNYSEDKNSVNAWKTCKLYSLCLAQQKSIEKPVLENENWPNLQSQSDFKIEGSRRLEDKYAKKNSKWNHSEIDSTRPTGRGRFSTSSNVSSSNSHSNTTPNRPRRGSNFAGRNRIVSDRGKNNGYNRMSAGRGSNRYEEDPKPAIAEHQNNDKSTKDSAVHQVTQNAYEESEIKPTDETVDVDFESKRSKEPKKVSAVQEEKHYQPNRGVNLISSQNILSANPFIIPSTNFAPNVVYSQPLATFPAATNQIIPDMFFGQIQAADPNQDLSYPTLKTPVIDIKNMLDLCETTGWDKVSFPKSLRESEQFVDKIPVNQLKDNDSDNSSSEEPKGGINNVIIIDNNIFLVPKSRYNTSFLKFTTKLDYIRHHLEQNLSRDTHLNSIINENRQTCPVSEVLQFNRLKWVKTTESELQEAAQSCSLIQLSVNSDGKMVIIPTMMNKETLFHESSNYPNSSNILAQSIEDQNYNPGESYPPQTNIAGSYEAGIQNLQNPNAAMVLSFISQNPQGTFINQSPAFMAQQQQQPHAQIHTQTAPNYYIPTIPNYFPVYQQNPHATVHNANLSQPNQANMMNNSSNVQNQTATNQTNNQTNPNNQTTPMLIANTPYLSANSVPSQPSLQVLTALSQQSPFFNNHNLATNTQVAMPNPNFRMAPLSASAFHPQSANQSFNQNMLFQFIPPPNNMTSHLLTNVFHQENLHNLVNRGPFMANQNPGPIVGNPNQGIPSSHMTNFSATLTQNSSTSNDQSRIANSNNNSSIGNSTFPSAAQKSPGPKLNSASENFGDSGVTHKNDNFNNE